MSVNVYGSVKLEQEMNRIGLGKFVTILTENGFDNWPAVCDITQDDYDKLGFDAQSQCLLQRLIVDSQTCDYDSPFNLTDNHATMNQSPATTEQQQPSPNGRQPRLGANGKRRYRRHPKPDLNAPRRPLTAYASFANYVRTEQAISTLTFVEIAREVGKRWQSLAQEERNTWEQHATGALNEYKQQVEKYKKTEQSRAYQRYLGDFKRQQQATQRVKEEDEDNEHELPEATEQACSVPRLCVADSTASSSSTISHSTSDSVDSSSFHHIEPPRTSSQMNSRTTIDIFTPVSEYSPERTGLMGQNSMVHGSAQSIFHIMVGPESSLSRVIIDFRDRCRWLIAQGTPFSAICGPDHIDVAAFFDRSRDMGLRVDGWACSLNHSFSDMDVYVLLAYIMFHTHFMRVSCPGICHELDRKH